MTPEEAHTRRGNATMLALGLMTLLAISALVVDIGFLYAAQTEIQAGTDAAALAGVDYYDLTASGVATARAKAIEMAGRHTIMGEPMVLPDSAIRTGYLDDAGAFVPSDVPGDIVAMQIDHTQVDIPVWFAAVAFGRNQLAATAHSVATRAKKRSAGRVECFLPLAIPDCVLDDTATFQNMELRLSSAGEDNVGWADLGGNPTPGTVGSALRDICGRGEALVGQDVYLNNGVMSTSLSELSSILSGAMTGDTVEWDPSHWGPIPAPMEGSTVLESAYGDHVVEGPIVLFEADGACLSYEQFNQTRVITGFAWAALYDVDSQGADQNIRVRLDLETPFDGGSAGGGVGNVMAPGVAVLVE